MKKCSVCYTVVDDKNAFCTNCGGNNFIYDNQNNYQSNYPQSVTTQPNDPGHPVIWGIIGYFIPLVGVILFFSWKKKYPQQAKGAGLGALINIGLTLFVIVFYITIFLIAAYAG